MELQEIFNKAHKHFAGMTEPSMGNEESTVGQQCAYRGAFGNKCVVGAFIPDELYNERLEGDALEIEHDTNYTLEFGYNDNRVTEILAKAFGQKTLTNEQYILLANLQRTHDRNAMDWENYEKKDGVPWYNFIKAGILSCAHDFKLEIGETK
tara:strand:+ start:98 stop:553 length:456 start_codon:yes stop_codon:yes gene_type:complete